MQKDIAGLRGDQELLQADALIGRSVTLHDGKVLVAPGVVSAVRRGGRDSQNSCEREAIFDEPVLSISTVPSREITIQQRNIYGFSSFT
jgi:hypothetical protein